jgi:hypothetical protein
MSVLAASRRGTVRLMPMEEDGEWSIVPDHILRSRQNSAPQSAKHGVCILNGKHPAAVYGENVQTRTPVEDRLHETEAEKTAVSDE